MKSSDIFAAGVVLRPFQLLDGRWAWVAVDFQDDSFDDDGEYVNPSNYFQEEKEDLIIKQEEENE